MALRWIFPFLLLLTLFLPACGVSLQDIKQEIQDDTRSTMEQMRRNEASYEKREYLGFTSDKSENWNSTDWSLWMDTHGGGR